MKFDFLDWEESHSLTSEEFCSRNKDYRDEDMMIPSLQNETDAERVERILEQMKSSTRRLDHFLGVFDRINR